MSRASRLDWLNDELERLEQQHLRRSLAVREGVQAARIRWRDRQLINFGSNDYLGLAADPRLIAACRKQFDAEGGWGAGASPLVTGRSGWHARLEADLAAFERAPAALLFTSGYAANVGTIAALVGPEDLVLSDAKNHASIIDGCRLSRAHVRVYRHGDMADLESHLRDSGRFRRRMIVSDSLFSMDGDTAPLTSLADLADAHACMLMLDEAHATGVFGSGGRGLCEAAGVEDRVDVRVGTLSKALGSHGGFVTGPRLLIDWLANRARSYVFSTAAPDGLAMAGCIALQIVTDEPERRKVLLENARVLRERLRSDGWNVGASTSQIVPVILGDARRAEAMSQALRNRGYLVPAIRPPSVPAGESLLRISVTYAHTRDMLEDLATTLRGQNTEN